MSSTYDLIARSMVERQQVHCVYQGHRRAICPVILGHTDDEERTLAFQFAGTSSKGLPPGGAWKCFKLAEMTKVELRRGQWHVGSSHRERQQCVKVVDLDVNPLSPYQPRRRV
ncbi:hypothetical protein [Bradyrhizobium sp. 149]|uniref:hypothetical protein n=1 Tax=Bradyrhizobium sp. 149 TaxID=2782624 RepID=UPI001FFB2AF1|nr:hypothetical protein [Bradyrhizobium sp. 149]